MYHEILLLFSFLWLHLWHVKVSRLGDESELQLQAYATAIATPGSSHICSLHHSSQQRQSLNPLSEARDWTHILMETILNPLSHDGNSPWNIFNVTLLVLKHLFSEEELSLLIYTFKKKEKHTWDKIVDHSLHSMYIYTHIFLWIHTNKLHNIVFFFLIYFYDTLIIPSVYCSVYICSVNYDSYCE